MSFLDEIFIAYVNLKKITDDYGSKIKENVQFHEKIIYLFVVFTEIALAW